MSIGATIDGWLPLVGGISGVLWITYMLWMGYHAHKKERGVQELQVQLAEIKGLLEGKKRE